MPAITMDDIKRLIGGLVLENEAYRIQASEPVVNFGDIIAEDEPETGSDSAVGGD